MYIVSSSKLPTGWNYAWSANRPEAMGYDWTHPIEKEYGLCSFVVYRGYYWDAAWSVSDKKKYGIAVHLNAATTTNKQENIKEQLADFFKPMEEREFKTQKEACSYVENCIAEYEAQGFENQ